ncbi:MAG TPA: YncE family protein [Allosphingosinicella sp.]|nr:YncE family protein [Allosphingosinicella sp.]
MKAAIGLAAALAAASASPAAVAPTGSAQSGPAGGGPGILLIANKGEDSLSFVDLASGRELARRGTGPNPHEIAVAPDGRRAAVVAYGGNAIHIFDLATREQARRIDLGANKAPHGIAWLSDGRIVATAEGSDALVVISADLERVTAIATGQEGSHMVAVSPRLDRAFVANMGSGTVSVIDLAAGRKLRDLPAGAEPEGIALTPDGRQLWVADRKGDVVRVFDTASFAELARIKSGSTPIRVAISPDGRTAVVSNHGGGDLSFIDVATRAVRTVKVSGQSGFGQVTILFGPAGRLYVAETGIDRIAELEVATGRLLGRLPAGKNGDGLAISPAALESGD